MFYSAFRDGTDPEEHINLWLPIGGSLGSGIFINAFGDANALIERRVFEELGGFTTDYGIGYEDWELFTKAVLKGYRLEVIPEPLYYYRVSSESMMKKVDRFSSELRRLRPYLYMDDKGLGVGVCFAAKLYLDSIMSKEVNLSQNSDGEMNIDSDFYKLKSYARKFWNRRWFRKLAKCGFKCMYYLERMKLMR